MERTFRAGTVDYGWSLEETNCQEVSCRGKAVQKGWAAKGFDCKAVGKTSDTAHALLRSDGWGGRWGLSRSPHLRSSWSPCVYAAQAYSTYSLPEDPAFASEFSSTTFSKERQTLEKRRLFVLYRGIERAQQRTINEESMPVTKDGWFQPGRWKFGSDVSKLDLNHREFVAFNLRSMQILVLLYISQIHLTSHGALSTQRYPNGLDVYGLKKIVTTYRRTYKG
ncbi:uncharacterized protein LACBIDRAFT_335293 [Laccaria bicolor S238N-H82]|uniref:Predicted protein n=1 Tax=Laccaria bicolor (strain S238N-H82 / ATCC MYA-4686) TaxID=486041 RepID=B0E1X4_LACBS|nr:uncharacterized protein LACBIDRAFT_335293 [Laccaria bicolor S238N-H82]EDQ99175.1 predicted protein [Laccaria bicolor S238N-H82]|eukprot:XP_001890192.1 predicted protein [Laccaria bicolor S238N-H82]